MRIQVFALVGLLFLAGNSEASAPFVPKRNAKKELEALARKLPFFSLNAFVCNGDPYGVPEKMEKDYNAMIRPLRERAFSEESDQKLPSALVRDKAFSQLDWQSLDQLTKLVNRLEKKAVIDPDELRDASHPLGMGHFEWSLKEADEKYPKQTDELLKQLSRWRTTLRNHLIRD